MHKTRREALDRAFDLLGKARHIVQQVLSEEQEAFDILPKPIQASRSGEQMSETIAALQCVLDGIEEQQAALELLTNVSTPERNCIGGPEQKSITGSARRPPISGAFMLARSIGSGGLVRSVWPRPA